LRTQHVDSQALDAAPVLELTQPGRDQRLVAVGQHVNGNPVDHVGDDAPELSVNLSLVDAQPFRQVGLFFPVQGVDVVPGQGADGLVIAANVLGDTYKRVPQALLFNVPDTALGHPHGRIDAGQRLDECAATVPALEAHGVGLDAHGAPPDGAISKRNRFWAVLIKPANHATFLAHIGQHCVIRLDDVRTIFGAYAGRLPAREV